MAVAPGHRLGQFIGDSLEDALDPVLKEFAEDHGLYLDRKGERACRPGLKKCTWVDDLGNAHDLDFVLERGGSDEEVGLPAAFIETAWRRYTKHSKNKAQEIQCAVLPLLAKYSHLKPFAGAVVAGDWTTNALNQLRTSGFEVLYIEYSEIIECFAAFDIDVRYDETTSDDYLAAQVEVCEALTDDEHRELGELLRKTAPDEFDGFMKRLQEVVLREIEQVIILPLYGEAVGYPSIREAIDALQSFVPAASAEFRRFEIQLRYNNGDEIRASFGAAHDAAEFLATFD